MSDSVSVGTGEGQEDPHEWVCPECGQGHPDFDSECILECNSELEAAPSIPGQEER